MTAPPYTFNRTVALQARLRKGWTQRQVSERCKELGREVNNSNLSKYERGEYAPSPPFLAVLAQALDLTVDDLITLREEDMAGDAA